MVIFNYIVGVIFTFYIIKFIKLVFSKKERQEIRVLNQKLDYFRKKPIKTLEEQKDFLNLKYPKQVKTKINIKVVWSYIIKALIFISVLQILILIFKFLNLNFSFIQTVLIIFGLPLLLNFVLSKFNLNGTDSLFILLRKGGKK